MKHTIMSGLLSSADPTNVIQKITIADSIVADALCGYLDNTLSNLPTPPIPIFYHWFNPGRGALRIS
jgi:hypothetical protein